MRFVRKRQYGDSSNQWQTLSIIGACIVAFLTLPTACKRSVAVTPAAQYAQIESLISHGQLEEALTKADEALKESSRPFWVARFRLETAKIRQIQGQSDEVIQILNQDKATGYPDPDLTAERLCLLSLAYAQKNDPAEAARAINEADRLTAVSP